jgi:uncharacterized membrane protein (UPF0127 family)/CheY-like chemotaxis protein
MRGLLGRRSLPAGEGIALRPAWSIHTAFMQFPIDVVFVDEDLVVLRIDATLRPFHTAACRGAREVIELAAGECARRGLSVGDRIAWASHTATVTPTAGSERGHQDAPRGRVLVASRDARFVKLTRFLLDGKGIETAAVVPVDRLSATLTPDAEIDAVVLDAHDSIASSLTSANSARAVRPEVPIIVVAESTSVGRSPAGIRIYDKWDETDEFVAAVEDALDPVEPEPASVAPPLDLSS